MSIIEILASLLKDELLGLAEDSSADPVFRNQLINMDVLYRIGETPQVKNYSFELSLKESLFEFDFYHSNFDYTSS